MSISRSALLQIAIVLLLMGALLLFSQEKAARDRSDRLAQELSPAAELDGASLALELGCNNCHIGLEGSNKVEQWAPDLSDAGMRYNPAYLFDFLQNPTRVRQHIGHTRMPDFGLSEAESLALTRYLSSLQSDKTSDLALPARPKGKGDPARGKALLEELSCLTCHNNGIEGQGKINDLAATAWRLQPEWVERYLAAPHRFNSKENLMPSLFYGETAAGETIRELTPGAAEKIRDINAYLFGVEARKSEELGKRFKKAGKDFPEADAAKGAAIFTALNCSSCHSSPVRGEWQAKNAPDLSLEGSRVQREWLLDYLKKPVAIRAHGFYPGSGSRMPDFGLTEREAALLTDFLQTQTKAGVPDFVPEPLTAFQREKAAAMLDDKLSCLGCHTLNGKGGAIGPDLSGINQRLQPPYLLAMIRDPHQLSDAVAMPKIPMDPRYQELIARYLWGNDFDRGNGNYSDLTAQVPVLVQELDSPAGLYQTYCAACHGNKGEADGWNADRLPVLPTKHANGAYMATRPDGTLFDGIYAGGYILNKSHVMPAWGETLSAQQIQELVDYMRVLCACKEPSWAGDD
jgi:mono/diheme cytochrome c family protein